MRKADLIEAILAAANGGERRRTGQRPTATAPTRPKPRRVRSARASQVADDDPIAALAAEEDALGADAAADEDADAAPGAARTSRDRAVAAPRRRPTSAPNGRRSERVRRAPTAPTTTERRPRATATTPTTTPDDGRGDGVDPEDERQSFGDGNRRGRRRRRGRGGQDQPGDEPRPAEFQGEPIEVEGLLDLRDEGYGFLRGGGYLPAQKDVYVSASQVRRFALRKGDFVNGTVAPAGEQREVPGAAPRRRHQRHDARRRARPSPVRGPHAAVPRLASSASSSRDEPHEITGRIVDLISPIGKGQRGLIVSPPKAGKTTILKQLVYAIERNNPEVHLMVLLVDERPEEVTDMRRHVLRGEVVASTFDRPADEHTQVAELAIERAKRLVEMGTDVVIVLDGITRLARAYNLVGADVGPHHVGWRRLHRALPAEEVLRRRPQHRGGRLAHDHRHRARSRPAAGWTR